MDKIAHFPHVTQAESPVVTLRYRWPLIDAETGIALGALVFGCVMFGLGFLCAHLGGGR